MMEEGYHEIGGSSRAPSAAGALPAALLSGLPRDPHAQLELAHSIVCHAYTQKVSQLEADNEQLQGSLMQAQQSVKHLERRQAGMEAELLEHQQRARTALSEQHKLVAEKNALIETVKRLNREVARLEHFKRNLLQQLQDDSEADASCGLGSSSYAAVDLTTERLVSEVLHSADGIAAAAAAGSQQQYPHQHHHHQQQQPQQQQQWSPPSKAAGKLGYASPRNNSSAGGGGPYGSSRQPGGKEAAVLGSRSAGIPAAGGPGRGSSGGGAGMASPVASSRGLAAAASAAAAAAPRFASPPPAAGGRPVAAAAQRAGLATSPRINGKEFFKQARARLSYEQFSQFLEAIKDLNAGRASREDTLGAAQGLFGPGNADLYGLFEGLLMRHLTSL